MSRGVASARLSEQSACDEASAALAVADSDGARVAAGEGRAEHRRRGEDDEAGQPDRSDHDAEGSAAADGHDRDAKVSGAPPNGGASAFRNTYDLLRSRRFADRVFRNAGVCGAV